MGVHRTNVLFLLLMASLVMLGGCPAEGDDDASQPTGDDDASSTPLITPSVKIGSPASLEAPPGVWEIPYILTGPSSFEFDIKVEWSTAGLEYFEASSATGYPPGPQKASPSGTAHTFQWDSLADLKYAEQTVFIKVSAEGNGYEGIYATTNIALDNTVFDSPCEVTIDTPEVLDGVIPINYSLSDQYSDICDVRIEVVIDVSTIPASPSTTLSFDALEDVVVNDGPLDRVFYWDSERDVGHQDRDIIFRIVVTDLNNDSSAEKELKIQNDPVPEANEFLITELLPWSNNAPVYVEFKNVAHHSLNLRSMFLSAKNNVTISADADVFVMPNEHAVVAAANDGDPAWITSEVSGLAFGLLSGTVELWRGNPEAKIVIAATSYNNSDFKDGLNAVAGHAISRLQSADTYNMSAWCVEQTALTVWPTDYGSPGVDADATSCLYSPAQ